MAYKGSLRTQFLLLPLIAAIGFLVILGAGYYLTALSATQSQLIQQQHIPLIKAIEGAEHQLDALSLIMESASETRRQKYLFQLQAVLPKLQQNVGDMAKLVSDASEDKTQLLTTLPIFSARLKQFVSDEVTAPPENAASMEQRTLEALYLKKTLTYLMTLVANIKNAQYPQMQSTYQQLHTQVMPLQLLSVAVAGGVVLALVLIGFAAIVRITRHLNALTDALQRFSLNEGIPNRIPDCHVLDEVGHTVASYNQVIEQLRQIASIDKLTGLKNFAFFSHEVNLRLDHYSPDQGRFSLMLLDVDYLKRFNDVHGVIAGNQALRMLAHFIRQYKPKDAELGRYTGGAFVMLLPRYHMNQAQVFAEQLRQDIERMPIQLRDAVPYFIQVSIGVSEYKPGESFRVLFKRADDALAEAKQNGRNRVELLR